MTETTIPLSVDIPAMLRQLRDNFLAQLDEKMGDIESDIYALERAKRFDLVLQRAYRKVYALECGAGTYGLPVISKICHQLEEQFNLFSAEKSHFTHEVLERCLAHLELMRTAGEQAKAGAEHFNDVEDALNALRCKILGEQYSALIVETSKVNIKLCQGIMKRYPINITVVDDGYQALEYLLQHKYHLLITGLEVKTLNGLALVAALRMSARGNHDMQAILLSSSKQPPFKRNVDPNFIVPRDSKFAENLGTAIESCIATLRQAEGVSV